MEDGVLVPSGPPVDGRCTAQAWDLLGQVTLAFGIVNWLRCCPTANCKAASPVFLVKVEQQTVL